MTHLGSRKNADGTFTVMTRCTALYPACASLADLHAAQDAATALGAKYATWGEVGGVFGATFAFEVLDLDAFRAAVNANPDNLFVQRCVWSVTPDRGAHRSNDY
jgi:hypothetical protein